MKTHSCIKPACANTYQSEEQDAYYCPACQEVNKALAKQIDAQVAARPKRNSFSAVQEYEAQKQMINNMPGVVVKI